MDDSCKGRSRVLACPRKVREVGTSDDLTIAAGSGDTQRQGQGFRLAAGEIMLMMLLVSVMSAGVIVITIVQWSGRC